MSTLRRRGESQADFRARVSGRTIKGSPAVPKPMAPVIDRYEQTDDSGRVWRVAIFAEAGTD